MPVLLGIITLMLLLFSLLCFRAWKAGQKPGITAENATVAEELALPHFDPDHATESLSMAVRIPTVSHPDPNETDWDVFDDYASFLRERYPVFHAMAECERVQGYALIYRLPGKNPKAKAVLWMSHQDVVPPGDPEEWTYPPFSGEVQDGVLWGRGALDMKSHTIAMFEACENYLAAGMALQHDLYFALGYDEEVGVETSAVAMSKHMAEKAVDLAYVLDESTNAFFDASLFDAKGTMACIGVSEKGFGNLEIEVAGEGGHASLPPRRSALMELTSALNRMNGKVFPAKIAPPISNMIEALLPTMPFRYRLLYANRFCTLPLVIRHLEKTPQTNAWVRTTAALTTAKASPQPNVLPRHARATFNVRTAPWDSAQDVGRKIVARLQKGYRGGEMRVISTLMDAAPVSALEGDAKELIFATVAECFPEAIPVPSLMLGGTDAAHFCAICSNVYRFSPFRSYQKFGKHIHNIDERIEVADFHHAIKFFLTLLIRGNDILSQG